MRVVRTTTATLAWLVAAFVAVMALAGPGGPLPFARVADQQPALTISGSIQGLEPGRPAALVLTVRNPSSYGAVVRTLSARVTSASKASCPVAALQIAPWHGRLQVDAHGAATASLPIRLSAGAGECRGTTWQLAYTSS